MVIPPELKIGVLMGGDSAEREVSLRSGEAVYKALKREGYEVKRIEISKEQSAQGTCPKGKYKSKAHTLTGTSRANAIKKGEIAEQIKESGINFAFIALHGGFGENGGMQALLEELNIPYSGSGVLASQRAMNKILSKNIFQQNDIPIPKYEVLRNGFFREDLELVIKRLEFPLVVKPTSEGSSIGVSIVRSVRRNVRSETSDKEELEKKIKSALGYSSEVIVEEYINGKEVTVGILAERALPPILLVPKNKFYNYAAKYEPGTTEYLVPAPLDKEISAKVQKTALNAYFALNCSVFARVDMMLNKKNQCFVLEVNTIPGFTETSLLPKAAKVEGIGFGELCSRIVELSLDKHLRITNFLRIYE